MERHNWTLQELTDLHEEPLLPLISKAHQVHMRYHTPDEIQTCTLISIKTGGCPEDCKYCAQSSRYDTQVKAEPLMEIEAVLARAKEAVARGSTRICLGAAWKLVRDSRQFDRVLEMVKAITDLGVEVCCTLGCLNEGQAEKLKKAGLFAYNHNLDSSERFYKTIITTRTYEDRLNTLDVAEKTGLSVCCGGIIGMGETTQDRLLLLQTLGNRNPHPESVPINQLVPVMGTPLGHQPKISVWEVVRMIALT
ncbi:MAG TPA: biotin synthase BioB, partial [Chlamydiales bacterium]|nr:biotin synthase BioB [Chlamydiales bacterium]